MFIARRMAELVRSSYDGRLINFSNKLLDIPASSVNLLILFGFYGTIYSWRIVIYDKIGSAAPEVDFIYLFLFCIIYYSLNGGRHRFEFRVKLQVTVGAVSVCCFRH